MDEWKLKVLLHLCFFKHDPFILQLFNGVTLMTDSSTLVLIGWAAVRVGTPPCSLTSCMATTVQSQNIRWQHPEFNKSHFCTMELKQYHIHWCFTEAELPQQQNGDSYRSFQSALLTEQSFKVFWSPDPEESWDVNEGAPFYGGNVSG